MERNIRTREIDIKRVEKKLVKFGYELESQENALTESEENQIRLLILSKRRELIGKMIECENAFSKRSHNQDEFPFTIYCIDVDGVIFDSLPELQKILGCIEPRSTNEYRVNIALEGSEAKEEVQKSFKILDHVLEERDYIEADPETGELFKTSYPRISYRNIYDKSNLLTQTFNVRTGISTNGEPKYEKINITAVDYINHLLANKRPNEFFIFLSHRNPVREGIIKAKVLYELCPEIDAVETLPFHIKTGACEPTSKALWLQEVYGLKTFANICFFDDSKAITKDVIKHFGNAIRVLTNGFNDKHTLVDHISKVPCLDPFMMSIAVSYARYVKEHPGCHEELDVPLEEIRRQITEDSSFFEGFGLGHLYDEYSEMCYKSNSQPEFTRNEFLQHLREDPDFLVKIGLKQNKVKRK